jgi:uridine kinase
MINSADQNERYNKNMKQEALITEISKIITQILAQHPLRVAVDGVDASGKTVFADALSEALTFTQRQVIRASVDGFHHPKAIRRQKGPLSPEGFYRDSYNYPALIENLLAPLSPGGDRHYRTAVFDLYGDRPIQTPWQTAEKDAILIVDGIFLLRETLLPYWDFKIYLHTDFIHSVPRGVARDQRLLGSKEEANLRYQQRYVPGQKIYLAEARPLDKADILIDNNILDNPEIIHRPGKS